MVFFIDADVFAASFNQVGTQVFNLSIRVDLVFRVYSLFSLIKMRHLNGMVGDIQVAVFVSVINSSVAPVYLRTFRDINMQQTIILNRYFLNGNISGRVKLLRVVDGSYKIFPNMCYLGRLNSLNRSVVFHAQQDSTAVPVEKRTDSFVEITIELVATSFEFEIDAFAFLN